jgi:hypothetical protein
MNKADILTQLRAAKAAHISWVQRAKMLIGGFTITENSIPVNSTECKFGKWFYSHAQCLNDIRNNPIECMEEIESLHFQLHDVYMNIYKIYYEMDKQGFFSKLFGKKKKVSDDDKVRAKEYYDEMEVVSKKLVNALNVMERRISVLSDTEIEGI